MVDLHQNLSLVQKPLQAPLVTGRFAAAGRDLPLGVGTNGGAVAIAIGPLSGEILFDGDLILQRFVDRPIGDAKTACPQDAFNEVTV